ncbi:MAG: transposase [Marinoscillum sp.]
MQPDAYYHLYNHANGDENLFRTEDNYHYFLMLWAKYIELVADTHAYCLMPNHFHALIKIKSEQQIRSNSKVADDLTIDRFISRTFSNFFNAYAKAYNKMYDRRGSLFNRPFKAKEISNDSYLRAVVAYIHRNPVHHGFCRRIEDWSHSSYEVYFSAKRTKIKREMVLDLFGGFSSLQKSHKLEPHIDDTSIFIDW